MLSSRFVARDNRSGNMLTRTVVKMLRGLRKLKQDASIYSKSWLGKSNLSIDIILNKMYIILDLEILQRLGGSPNTHSGYHQITDSARWSLTDQGLDPMVANISGWRCKIKITSIFDGKF